MGTFRVANVHPLAASSTDRHLLSHQFAYVIFERFNYPRKGSFCRFNFQFVSNRRRFFFIFWNKSTFTGLINIKIYDGFFFHHNLTYAKQKINDDKQKDVEFCASKNDFKLTVYSYDLIINSFR